MDDAETHLHTQHLVEVGVEPKPVTVSRAEIYNVHGLLLRNQAAIVGRSDRPVLRAVLDSPATQMASPQDPIGVVLDELEGVPNVAYQEGANLPVTLVLTNRFANVRGQYRFHWAP